MYSCTIHGVLVETGDIICTKDGGSVTLSGQFWWAVGKLIPGDIDHIVIYIGPGSRCIESGPGGVVAFNAEGNWDGNAMRSDRNGLIDTFYGVVYPLAGRGFSKAAIAKIRENVSRYCIDQLGKPYNFTFPDSTDESRFYCSQLAYKAYLREKIDLNTGKRFLGIPGTESIIFPQEIWEGCEHLKLE